MHYAGSARYETPGEVYGPPDPVVKTGMTAYRHQRGANVVYFDAHGEWVGKEKIKFNRPLWYAMQ